MKGWRLRELLAAPFRDMYRGLERCLDGGPWSLAQIAAGLVVGWWIYVPVHELLHALACLAFGGEVTRLEIAPLYGGDLLARVFPFVVSGGEYAGRLAGFDTGGNDLIYLATVLGPYLLTLFPGVWALRASGTASRSFPFGLSLPIALAPFISIPGDAYEIGSILVTSVPPWATPATAELLRGDDLFRQIVSVGRESSQADWAGLILAALVGLAWASATYAAGAWISSRLRSSR